jgi:hypothetical protein
LLGLAARLSWSVIKETVLGEAMRSACLVEAGPERDELVAQVGAQYPSAELPAVGLVPTPEPDCEVGPYRGRFVMLRQVGAGVEDGVSSQGRLATLEELGERWVPFAKAIYFPAEVESAPGLVRRSLLEACEHDPASIPFWRGWLLGELGGNATLRGELLGLLPGARP